MKTLATFGKYEVVDDEGILWILDNGLVVSEPWAGTLLKGYKKVQAGIAERKAAEARKRLLAREAAAKAERLKAMKEAAGKMGESVGKLTDIEAMQILEVMSYPGFDLPRDRTFWTYWEPEGFAKAIRNITVPWSYRACGQKLTALQKKKIRERGRAAGLSNIEFKGVSVKATTLIARLNLLALKEWEDPDVAALAKALMLRYTPKVSPELMEPIGKKRLRVDCLPNRHMKKATDQNTRTRDLFSKVGIDFP